MSDLKKADQFTWVDGQVKKARFIHAHAVTIGLGGDQFSIVAPNVDTAKRAFFRLMDREPDKGGIQRVALCKSECVLPVES